MSRKKDKVLQGRYVLNPRTKLKSDDAKVIDALVDDFNSLPKVYDENQEQVTKPSSRKPPKNVDDIQIVESSDAQFRQNGNILMSDPRLVNQPNKSTYVTAAKEIGKLLYYPGVDREAVSRLGALMIIKAKLSDANIASNLRKQPLNYNPRDVNQRINDEIDRIVDQVNLLSRPEIIRRIEQINTSVGIRAVTIREQAKAFEAAKTQRERLAAIRDMANEVLPKIASDNE